LSECAVTSYGNIEVVCVTEYAVESYAEVVVNSNEKRPLKVLHVDDEASFSEISKQCLEMQGPFQVDTASSVEEATEKLKKETYDAVVSDYRMPGKDGLEFLKELRQSGNTVPFLIFTGRGREEVAIKALNLGAEGYFSKIGSPETVYGELARSICQIVESKKAKEALRTNESYLRAILDSMFTGLIIIDEKTHKIFDANFHALETIAAPREDVIGKICHKFICPAEEGKCPITDLGQTVDRSERVLLRADGQRIPILKTVTTIIQRGRKYLIESFVDITERKRAEEALKNNERKYREFADSLPEIAFELDEKGNVTFFNRRAFEILGYSQEDFRSMSILRFLIPQDRVRMKENIQKILKGEKSGGNEYTLLRKDGSTFPALAFTNRIVSEDGKRGLRGVIIDISEQKNAEKKLRESEEKFRGLAEQSPNMIFINKKGRVVYANKKAGETMGYTREEFYSPDFNFLALIAPESRELIKSDFAKHMKGEEAAPYEYKLLTRQGRTIDAILTSKLITYDGESAILGTVTDISEHRQEQEAARRSAEQARSLLEFQNKVIDTAIVWINLLDREGNVTLWNRAAELISGFSREEVIGHKKIWEWHYPDPEYRAKIFAHQRRTIEHKESAFRDFETVIRCKNGALKTISWYSNNILDENGVTVGSIAMGIDVTELKKAEKELQEAIGKLGIMNEKLRVVGRLSRHDVRNKLQLVALKAYLAKRELPAESKVVEDLAAIEKAVQQSVEIFEFARVYEMLGSEELVYIDVEKTVSEAALLFLDLKGVNVVNECRGLTVLADSLLRQLFYNLIDNSLKYGQKVTRIRVHYERTSQDALKLVFEDDGVGIPIAEKPKLFKEGYSTGGSTGYGLYLIKKMMEVYGWTIQETGEPGKGAQFTMTIPETNQNGKENRRIA